MGGLGRSGSRERAGPRAASIRNADSWQRRRSPLGSCPPDGRWRTRAAQELSPPSPPLHHRGVWSNDRRFTKDRFGVDFEASTVTCPAAHTVAITFGARGGKAIFAPHCAACPLRADCTTSAKGRSITIHLHEAALQRAKAAQQSEEWETRYRSDRPIVEHKIAHFTRRPWGGRQARFRGLERIKTDTRHHPSGRLNCPARSALRKAVPRRAIHLPVPARRRVRSLGGLGPTSSSPRLPRGPLLAQPFRSRAGRLPYGRVSSPPSLGPEACGRPVCAAC